MSSYFSLCQKGDFQETFEVRDKRNFAETGWGDNMNQNRQQKIIQCQVQAKNIGGDPKKQAEGGRGNSGGDKAFPCMYHVS